MTTNSEAFAAFADNSYSWRFIEEPAFDRAIGPSAYMDAPYILDVGSGHGRVVDYHIRRGATAVNIWGVEPDSESVEKSRQRFPEVNFIEQTIQETPFAPNSFDIVTAQLSLRYLSDGELAVTCNKLARSLRPGGLFFMLDAHPVRYGMQDGFDRYFHEGNREVATPWGGHERYYYRTLATYTNTLIRAGFTFARLDECPIAEAGKTADHAKEHARYAVSPARFAIQATKRA